MKGKAIVVRKLPAFDAARYLDNEKSIAAYLTDVLAANDPALPASAVDGRQVCNHGATPRRNPTIPRDGNHDGFVASGGLELGYLCAYATCST